MSAKCDSSADAIQMRKSIMDVNDVCGIWHFYTHPKATAQHTTTLNRYM